MPHAPDHAWPDDVLGRRVLNLASSEVLFWQPRYTGNSASLAHLPFLLWLVQQHAPQRVVQFGMGDGSAYLAICQAVEELGLNSACKSISILEHGGEVPDAVLRQHALHYEGFSTLASRRMAEAMQPGMDGAIDLMVVNLPLEDACLTALRSQWRDRFSPRGIAIFLDSAMRMGDDASLAWLAELREAHPAFELETVDGLLTLAVGSAQEGPLMRLAALAHDSAPQRVASRVFHHLGNSLVAARHAAEQTVAEGQDDVWLGDELGDPRYRQRLADIAQLGHVIAGKDEEISRLRAALEDGEWRSHILSRLAVVRSDLRLALAGKAGWGGRWRAASAVQADIRRVAASELFDAEWYLAFYPDVAEAGCDPARHFVTDGAYELRNPSPRFDTFRYHRAHPDVTVAGMVGLLHYLRNGQAENREIFAVGVTD